MDWVLLGRPVSLWIVSSAIFVGVAVGVPIVRAVIRRRYDPQKHPLSSWRGLIGGINARWLRLSTLLLAAAAAAIPLYPPAPGGEIIKGTFVVVLGVQALLAAGIFVDWTIQRVGRFGKDAPNEEAARAARGTLTGLRWLVLIVLYAFIVLIALQNLGVNVTAMIAGLGIGGIAVALAVQNILGDLFASLTIALDKPFVVGDFIIAGSEMGSVEHVGLKTTRVRSLSGEQLVFSNSDLLSSRIRNYKRMAQRRVVVGFGVEYSTPPEVLEQIPGMVRECVESSGDVKFDRCHFAAFGASSLDFETVYYINSADYNVHMDVQQKILLGVARRFSARNIGFAFPTRTLHLASMPPKNTPEERLTPSNSAGSADLPLAGRSLQ